MHGKYIRGNSMKQNMFVLTGTDGKIPSGIVTELFGH